MKGIINATWRAYLRDHIPANLMKAAVAAVDFDRINEAFWCVEMALDENERPRVVANHGICDVDNLPETAEGRVLILCPIDALTSKMDLMDFNAASNWD